MTKRSTRAPGATETTQDPVLEGGVHSIVRNLEQEYPQTYSIDQITSFIEAIKESLTTDPENNEQLKNLIDQLSAQHPKATDGNCSSSSSSSSSNSYDSNNANDSNEFEMNIEISELTYLVNFLKQEKENSVIQNFCLAFTAISDPQIKTDISVENKIALFLKAAIDRFRLDTPCARGRRNVCIEAAQDLQHPLIPNLLDATAILEIMSHLWHATIEEFYYKPHMLISLLSKWEKTFTEHDVFTLDEKEKTVIKRRVKEQLQEKGYPFSVICLCIADEQQKETLAWHTAKEKKTKKEKEKERAFHETVINGYINKYFYTLPERAETLFLFTDFLSKNSIIERDKLDSLSIAPISENGSSSSNGEEATWEILMPLLKDKAIEIIREIWTEKLQNIIFNVAEEKNNLINTISEITRVFFDTANNKALSIFLKDAISYKQNKKHDFLLRFSQEISSSLRDELIDMFLKNAPRPVQIGFKIRNLIISSSENIIDNLAWLGNKRDIMWFLCYFHLNIKILNDIDQKQIRSLIIFLYKQDIHPEDCYHGRESAADYLVKTFSDSLDPIDKKFYSTVLSENTLAKKRHAIAPIQSIKQDLQDFAVIFFLCMLMTVLLPMSGLSLALFMLIFTSNLLLLLSAAILPLILTSAYICFLIFMSLFFMAQRCFNRKNHEGEHTANADLTQLNHIEKLKKFLHPLTSLKEWASEKSSPYLTAYTVLKDVMQPIRGIANIVAGAFYISTCIFRANNHTRVSALMKGVNNLLTGCLQVLSSPLTYLSIPLRLLLTCTQSDTAADIRAKKFAALAKNSIEITTDSDNDNEKTPLISAASSHTEIHKKLQEKFNACTKIHREFYKATSSYNQKSSGGSDTIVTGVDKKEESRLWQDCNMVFFKTSEAPAVNEELMDNYLNLFIKAAP